MLLPLLLLRACGALPFPVVEGVDGVVCWPRVGIAVVSVLVARGAAVVELVGAAAGGGTGV